MSRIKRRSVYQNLDMSKTKRPHVPKFILVGILINVMCTT